MTSSWVFIPQLFGIGLPNITGVLAGLYNWQLQNQKSASIHHFLSAVSVLYHIQCSSYMLTLTGQRLSFPVAVVMSVS